MSLFITALASGSNGNCYYIGTATEAILVDAGISCKEVEKRMHRVNLPMRNLKAIFISHEHADHIHGVPVLAKKYALPVYITTTTVRNCGLKLQGHLIHSFSNQVPVAIGNLLITPFSKAHDAADPHSFTVAHAGVTVGVFTDIGVPCTQLAHYFGSCHAAFLEANYDEQMLDKGNYPYHLKNRIRGGRGHLSNRQALEVFNKHRPSFMSHLFLAHLSKNNNCPQLVEALFTAQAAGTKIVIASRYAETAVYAICATEKAQATPVHYRAPVSQLAFSFED